MKRVYGYIRVSSKDQNEARQKLALLDHGVPIRQIYIDKASGGSFDRPAYKELLKKITYGDLLVIKSIDRLGRNYEQIMEQWRILTKEKNVDIIVIDMPLLDTTKSKDLLGTFISDIVLQLLSFVAENERKAIKQRQAEGIAAAQARGVKFGRPKRKVGRNFDSICLQWIKGDISTQDALKLCNLPASTFYRKVRTLKNKLKINGIDIA